MSENKKYYPEVNPNPDFASMEKEVLDFWKNHKTFEKSVAKNTGEEFVFYDGPPFANGLPHYGHLLTGFVKDVFARYQTMQGKKVERRFGWDCHGLPAEMGSEKELGISGRQAIQNFGIDKFNEHCRTSVMKYTAEWEEYVTRQARWVDFKNDYKTMDTNFMESVLWAFKQLYDKGLVYEAHRVMPYSWAAETPLSNFETKLDNSYREREDKAITVAFELNSPPANAPKADKYYILAWTTTPWTLPSNLALGVNREVDYEPVIARIDTPYFKKGDCIILSKNKFGYYAKELGLDDGRDLSKELLNPDIPSIKGSDLIGLTYKPLFPYFKDNANSFRILDGSSFVTDGDGTGIVHLAPAFGEEDQKCCENAEPPIQLVCPVDGQGKYTDEIFDIPLKPSPSGRGLGEGDNSPDSIPHPYPLPEGEGVLSLRGLNVIAENVAQYKFGEANERIINWLKNNGKLIKQEQIKHNYPHCWRTDTPLIYRAMPSWYVEVTKFRDRAAELNQEINWIPAHIRDGQMGHMLKTAPDWSISRNRFWGTPIPVWRSKSGKIIVIGSIAELEELSGEKVADLHRPYIDNIKISRDGEEYTRVEDVFDCWFESGSMPFAQLHYPFENKEFFEEHFPADFITEYVGQTRGWFNTLIMLSTALFDKVPFKNCICHGVVLDAETGLKYSKRLKNYKDPMEVINQFGADALRWLMIASPVMRGQDLMVDPDGKFIRDVVRLAIKPIWNAYNFFTLYANADGIEAKIATDSADVMDRYIIAKCNGAVAEIENAMNAYDTPSACEAVLQFFDALNNWYIRRNKERFWKAELDGDKQAAYDTLYTVLTTMCRAAASLLPLTCEEIYKGLTEKPSPTGRGWGEGIPTKYNPKIDNELLTNARELRKNTTDAESLMWSLLRNRNLANAKFKRQVPIGNYIADFYCHEAKLVIELDGGQHAEQQNYDEKRTKFLEAQGNKVLRFWNNEVFENTDGVLQVIYEYLISVLGETPSPHPLPKGEGVNSVHLATFPTCHPALVAGSGEDTYEISSGNIKIENMTDNKLIVLMDIVRDICSTALSIRSSVNIRVRQPLMRLDVVMQGRNISNLGGWGLLLDTIKDEVNIKFVEIEGRDVNDVANYVLKINSAVLGKRLPALMKQILPASKKGEWKKLENGDVEICGEVLLASEYTLQLEPKPEYKDKAQALSTNDALVILDTTITPELEAEGIARDIVRMIQQARKDANLNVSDKIHLHISANEKITPMIATHQAYILEQTLSVELLTNSPQNPTFTANNELDGNPIIISFVVAI